MQSFYHVTNDIKTGPYDLTSMVKRIKNGKLQPTDLVCIDDNPDAVAANSIPIFHEYFVEIEYDTDLSKREPMYPKATQHNASGISAPLPQLLKNGWQALLEHQRSAILVAFAISGIMLLVLGLGHLLGSIGSALFIGALSGVLLHLFYLNCALMLSNASDKAFLEHLKLPTLRSLLLASAGMGALCIGLPLGLWSLIGSASLVLLVLGMITFGLTLAAPLLWLKAPQTDSAPLIRESIKLFTSAPKPLLMNALMLQGIVVFSALLFIFPLVILLPVVAFAWQEVVDSAAS